MDKDNTVVISEDLDGVRLDAALRACGDGASWSRVRAWIQSGKVFVNDRAAVDPGLRVRAGQHVTVRMYAPRPSAAGRLTSESIAYVDSHLVVVRKPAGISTIPFERGERGALVELVRAWLTRTAPQRRDRAKRDLGVVHRIDKETSGLVVFARSLAAKRGLDAQMHAHDVERQYFAVAHGRVDRATLASRLVANRGDGIRGSTDDPQRGRQAVTHVAPVKALRGATLVTCRLETGRTHQIRIHLAEAGHPLVGERVYVRGMTGPFLPAPRLMLHAATLGFTHPVTGLPLQFDDRMPDDMVRVIERLERR
ncbi:MAG: RluA family pseudouridine synthase [Myxococcota bacterium]